MTRHLAVVVVAACGHTVAPSGIPDSTQKTDSTAASDAANPASDATATALGYSGRLFSGHWPMSATTDPASPSAEDPFPAYGVTVLRLWGMDSVQWAVLEPSRGTFQLQNLEHAIAAAQAHGIAELEYTFGMVPAWANGGTADASCYRASDFAATCRLPSDVLDTTTACTGIPQAFRDAAGLEPGNCQFQEFAFAVVEAANPAYDAANGVYVGTLQIHDWSPWNEINLTEFVDPPCKTQGATSCQAIARIAHDVYQIVKTVDPTAVVATPAVSANSKAPTDGPAALAAYLETGAPGAYADVLVHHCYANNGLNPPEQTAALLDNFNGLLSGDYGMAGKPRWCDEGGWAQNVSSGTLANPACTSSSECIAADSDAAAQWIVRDHVIHIDEGTAQFNWYGGGAGWWGALGTYDTQHGFAFTHAEQARAALATWVIGSDVRAGMLTTTGTAYTFAIPGRPSATVASCYAAIATPPAYAAAIIWDTTTPHAFDAIAAGYTSYCTYDGVQHAATHADTIGLQPILWEKL